MQPLGDLPRCQPDPILQPVAMLLPHGHAYRRCGPVSRSCCRRLPSPARGRGEPGVRGLAYRSNAGFEAGDRGVRSSFDVVPTLCELLGEPPEGVSGSSLLR